MNTDRYDFEDSLQKDESKAYKKILKEIEENKQFYLSAKPEEVAHSLIENCQISKESLYKIMKTINLNN